MSNLPSGFRSREEYNEYMKKYLREYRKRRHLDRKKLMRRIRESTERQKQIFLNYRKKAEPLAIETFQKGLVSDLVEEFEKPQFKNLSIEQKRALAQPFLARIDEYTQKFQREIHEMWDQQFAQLLESITELLVEAEALLHISPPGKLEQETKRTVEIEKKVAK